LRSADPYTQEMREREKGGLRAWNGCPYAEERSR
jgi:hypothetical protein